MAIDVYPVPIEQKVYVRQNLFSDKTQEPFKSSIGVNIYQDFAYTQANSNAYLAMTTGVTARFNQWAEFGVFCSYWFPAATIITTNSVSKPTMDLGHNVYCGNTIGFIPWAEKIVHPKFALDLGIGSATGSQFTACANNTCNGPSKEFAYTFFVIKPAVILETNLFSFLQWTLGLRYRFEISTYGPNDSTKFDAKASWLEISTGPVFNVR